MQVRAMKGYFEVLGGVRGGVTVLESLRLDGNCIAGEGSEGGGGGV